METFELNITTYDELHNTFHSEYVIEDAKSIDIVLNNYKNYIPLYATVIRYEVIS